MYIKHHWLGSHFNFLRNCLNPRLHIAMSDYQKGDRAEYRPIGGTSHVYELDAVLQHRLIHCQQALATTSRTQSVRSPRRSRRTVLPASLALTLLISTQDKYTIRNENTGKETTYQVWRHWPIRVSTMLILTSRWAMNIVGKAGGK